MHLDNISWKVDPVLGYEYSYCPSHPLANKAGKVYKHICVACERLGRPLKANEHVHHIDFNKLNNSIENLLVCTNRAHVFIHQHYLPNWEPVDRLENRKCLNCGKEFTCSKASTQKYCSRKCVHIASRKIRFTKEELEQVIWKYPTTYLAKLYGISDVAIGKWCKKLNISKPPRGYWINKSLLK